MANENTEKDYSKIQWFIFVILIPLLFAITLSLVILTVAGMNVFDLAKKYGEKVPVISSMIDDENDKATSDENSVFQLKATVEDQKATIANFEAQITEKDETIKALQEEVKKLTEELQQIKNEKNKVNKSIEDIASMYAEMSSKNAAAILTELENEEAVDILLEMDNEARGAIFSKMEPIKAAELTRLLKPEQGNETAAE